jgi:thioredoxin-like negative regulator of GroEL
LKKNFDDCEAHTLLLEIFTELGSKNELVIEGRGKVKDIMLSISNNLS